jgi:hypothetical protein
MLLKVKISFPVACGFISLTLTHVVSSEGKWNPSFEFSNSKMPDKLERRVFKK